MKFSRILKQSWKEKKTTKSQFPKCENVDLAVKVGVMCRLDPSGGHHLIARPGKIQILTDRNTKNRFYWWVSKLTIANAQRTRELSALTFDKVIVNNNLLKKLFQSSGQTVLICHQITNMLLSICSQAFSCHL